MSCSGIINAGLLAMAISRYDLFVVRYAHRGPAVVPYFWKFFIPDALSAVRAELFDLLANEVYVEHLSNISRSCAETEK